MGDGQVDKNYLSARRRRRPVLLAFAHLTSAGRGIWIVKPTNASCGRGITVEASLNDVASAVALLDHSAIVQKYIERPLLVRILTAPNGLVV